jgi:hypothetical protein
MVLGGGLRMVLPGVLLRLVGAALLMAASAACCSGWSRSIGSPSSTSDSERSPWWRLPRRSGEIEDLRCGPTSAARGAPAGVDALDSGSVDSDHPRRHRR